MQFTYAIIELLNLIDRFTKVLQFINHLLNIINHEVEYY